MARGPGFGRRPGGMLLGCLVLCALMRSSAHSLAVLEVLAADAFRTGGGLG